ncbi:MAG TPA: aminotransferase class III-fold pyridoxal phosphate-dependent enzyme [Methanomicrobia archaeon]|nr:aminotransferase class III-fold pyridoxal phosphate-dependent enzyme [Methanomicrobia archaeon]
MRNEDMFREAGRWLVGGVNSPVRASIKPYPFFTESAKGAYMLDIEGSRYCDYCLAYGPLILGHADPAVVESVSTQLGKGTTYGTPTPLEVDYAKRVCELAPNIEMIRAVNSGTEATMAALRLTRAVTGRQAIATVDGGYHGAHDCVLARREGASTVASSQGIIEGQVSATRIVDYNDIESLEEALSDRQVAAFIIEPVMGNVGCIPPDDGYLGEVRKVCSEHDTMLIFDETITGFRLAPGGAQQYYGVDADIVTYGKIAGGGLPIGIVGSSLETMERLKPVGDVYNAGTFSGNPLSMAAGLAALDLIASGDVLPVVHSSHERLTRGLDDVLPEGAVLNHAPGMFQVYFGRDEVRCARDARAADQPRFMQFWKKMFSAGFFLPPSQFESNFISRCHDERIIDATLEAMEGALR